MVGISDAYCNCQLYDTMGFGSPLVMFDWIFVSTRFTFFWAVFRLAILLMHSLLFAMHAHAHVRSTVCAQFLHVQYSHGSSTAHA